jgi:hypothetical protein
MLRRSQVEKCDDQRLPPIHGVNQHAEAVIGWSREHLVHGVPDEMEELILSLC